MEDKKPIIVRERPISFYKNCLITLYNLLSHVVRYRRVLFSIINIPELMYLK